MAVWKLCWASMVAARLGAVFTSVCLSAGLVSLCMVSKCSCLQCDAKRTYHNLLLKLANVKTMSFCASEQKMGNILNDATYSKVVKCVLCGSWPQHIVALHCQRCHSIALN